MSWLKRLDDELVLPLTASAQAVMGNDARCELDLLNGGFRVVVRRPFSHQERQAVRAAVIECAKALRPNLADCDVTVRRPQVTAYTSHIDVLPQDVRPFGMPSYFTVFELPLAQVFAFREAEARLAAKASAAARVVGFAVID